MPRVERNNSEPWVQVQAPTRKKGITRIDVRFTPDYVRGLVAPKTSRVAETRGEYLPDDRETLLLDDVLSIEGSSVFVRAWLIPARRKGQYHLRVEIAAPAPRHRNVRIILRWGAHQYSAHLRAGTTLFEDISLPDLARWRNNLPSRQLQLSFEFENGGTNGKH
jgi:hypothetical protein